MYFLLSRDRESAASLESRGARRYRVIGGQQGAKLALKLAPPSLKPYSWAGADEKPEGSAQVENMLTENIAAMDKKLPEGVFPV